MYVAKTNLWLDFNHFQQDKALSIFRHKIMVVHKL